MRRLLIVSACFLMAAVIGNRAMQPENVALRGSLDSLPSELGPWSGRQAPALGDDVVATLGVDAYLNRVYSAPGRSPIALYVGYYESQKQGDTMHSPLNCLPGAGWQIDSRTHVAISTAGQAVPAVVNRFVIEKGLDRQVVLYWYQSQGRVEASEYWSKAFMVWHALRNHRSDAAMVRIITPVPSGVLDSTDAAGQAVAFAQFLFPHLERLLPS